MWMHFHAMFLNMFFFDPAEQGLYFEEIALHLLKRSAHDYPPTETLNRKTQMFVVFVPQQNMVGRSSLKYHIFIYLTLV